MGSRPTRFAAILTAVLALAGLSAGQSVSDTKLKELGSWLSGRALTIDEAVSVALRTNRSYSIAISELKKARGRTDASKVALMPQAGLSGTFTYLDSAFSASFGGASIPIDNQATAAYEAILTLPIDITGASRAAVSQAQFNEIAARIDVNRVRNQVVYDVRYAFFQALRAQAQLTVAEDSLQNRLRQLSDTQKNLAAGLASNFDVITAKRDVADAQQGVINARAQITLTLASLKYVMGIDVSTDIRITDAGAVTESPATSTLNVKELSTDRAPTPSNLLDLGPSYQATLNEALESRPEVLEWDASLSAAKRGIAFAGKSALPDVSLFTSYSLDPNATDLSPAHQGAVGLLVNIPIFDGGRANALRRQAVADLEKANTSRRGAIDLVTLDVQQALVNMAQAQAKIEVATVGLAQANEAYRMAGVRFRNGIAQTGVSPQLEVSSAQTNLALAQENMLNARYDLAVAKSQLERATGRYSYGVGPGFATRPDRKITGKPLEQGQK